MTPINWRGTPHQRPEKKHRRQAAGSSLRVESSGDCWGGDCRSWDASDKG